MNQIRVEDNWSNISGNHNNVDAVEQELNGFQKEAWLQLILHHAPKKEKLEVLDVGCGLGFFSILLSQAGHTVTGIDCSTKRVELAKQIARQQGADPAFAVCDAHQTDFADGSFDLVVSRNLTWTLLDAPKAYREWNRILRPGGSLLIFDANWNLRYNDLQYARMYREDEANYQKKYGRPIHEYTPEMHAFRKEMPLCKVLRPQWDVQTLIEMGCKNVSVELDITDLVWDEEQKARFRSTPLFMIKTEKEK